ncbi:YihY/virulence factor BrkB family protein [Desulfogranum marinum]|uniref:YihY/virulence factor BrkB family protein n=1 Tax=Desulfogranum marinum TaxID=453220 RepID=UPI0019656766|nr:YihY/virulence factor BrkB family protein [Desulfogranum marinum]MBM9513756.1 YihY/virulence factor BrkB family protein [Desulfogranum marinum]
MTGNFQNWSTPIIKWAFTETATSTALSRGLRCAARILIIVCIEATRAKISIRASALTYSVILSMVPLLAMSTAVLKGLGSGDQLRVAAIRFIEQVEPRPTVHQTQPESTSPDLLEKPVQNTMTAHLYRAVDTIFNYVDKTNFAALGIFGIGGTLLVVIMVFSTIEDAMNDIWREEKGRPLFRKVMDYLALLILLPISINMALAGETILASERMMSYIQTIIPLDWMIAALFNFLPFVFIIITLMLVYLFFSRARVTTSAAFTGALFASIFWFLTQKVYIILQVGVAKYNAIYGSFATVPLFLVWVYLGWNFILSGAALAYGIQHRNNYLPFTDTIVPQRRLQLAFDILHHVYTDFHNRRTTTVTSLADRLKGTPTSVIKAIAANLVTANLLHSNDDNDKPAFLPVTSAELVKPGEVLDAIVGRTNNSTYGSHLADLALEGAHKALAQITFQIPVNEQDEK